jgi:galactokinase
LDAAVARGYEAETGIKPDVFLCRAADGAKQVL